MSDEEGNEIAAEPETAGPRFTLEELFRDKRPEQWRAEYAGAYDWGPDVGREIVDE